MTTKILRSICTLGPIGYLPGSGTIASLVTLPLVYALSSLGWIPYTGITIVLTVVAFKVCSYAFSSFAAKDPREIVIDEVIGCLFTFIGMPLNMTNVILGFCFFRMFDIFKWLGIHRLEQHSDAWGVMLDDIAAGILANIVVRFITM